MKKVVFLGLVLMLTLSIASNGMAWRGKEAGPGCKRAFLEDQPGFNRQGCDRQGCGRAFEGHPQKMIMMLKEKLDLNPGQVRKIKELAVAQKKEMIRLRASVQVARIEIAEILMEPETTEKRLEAQLDKLSSLTAEKQKSHIQFILDVKKLLTGEQLKKLPETMPFGFMRNMP
ncbi:MAG: periplasmic heavy metal sensor [bacterium]|nr:periplasmic heavy metal sensor [bacterium]